MKNIKNILRTQALLQENVRQAEKLLKQTQTSLENPQYLRIKSQLQQSNNLGLLGPLVKLSIDKGKFNPVKIERMHQYIIQNKVVIEKLSRPLHAYENSQELVRDVNQVELDFYKSKIVKQLSQTTLKNELAATRFSAYDPQFVLIKKFLVNLTPEQQRGFWVNSARYKSLEELYDSIKKYMLQIGERFYYESKLREAQAMGSEQVEILHSDAQNQLLLLQVKSFEAAQEVGLSVWCVVRQQEHYDLHTRSGDYGQFFFYDFRPQTPFREQGLAFTLTPSGKITRAQDRHNDAFPDIMRYLQKLGVDTSKLQVPEIRDAFFDEYSLSESILRELRSIIK